MRLVIERVKSATLKVDDKIISEIGAGLLVLVGVCKGDSIEKVKRAANKIATMRIFECDDKMNLSVLDTKGKVLLVSNFTLCTKETSGARPDFGLSADRDTAKNLYLALADELDSLNVPVHLGAFGEDMQINAHLDGPITIFKEI
ncbi:MAG: D-tyrosyl-tRNA(Tyr) deacylase [Clostridia bacterium]|nr:D-tyrosyl-tRNA(Tyr) deacylase [Clostridia bacterium]